MAIRDGSRARRQPRARRQYRWVVFPSAHDPTFDLVTNAVRQVEQLSTVGTHMDRAHLSLLPITREGRAAGQPRARIDFDRIQVIGSAGLLRVGYVQANNGSYRWLTPC